MPYNYTSCINFYVSPMAPALVLTRALVLMGRLFLPSTGGLTHYNYHWLARMLHLHMWSHCNLHRVMMVVVELFWVKLIRVGELAVGWFISSYHLYANAWS